MSEISPGAAASGPSGWSPRAYLPELASAMEKFATVLAEGDLSAPVSACPGWRLTDLAVHLGGVHLWAVHAVVEGNPNATASTPPTDRTSLVGWYSNAGDTLLHTLKSVDPDAAAWTFGPKPRTAGFWFRRQTHESLMHLWDATASQRDSASQKDSASQRETMLIGNDLCLDGIDEVVTLMFPRQARLGRIAPLPGSIALAATSGDASVKGGAHGARWVLAGDGSGPQSSPDAPAAATITGSGQALLLLLWRRIGLDDDRLSVSGEVSLARAVLALALTP